MVLRVRLGCTVVIVLGVLLVHFRPARAQLFVRGDTDASGRLQVADAVVLLRALFLGEIDRVTCHDAADSDDDGNLDLTDAVFVLNSLFRGGARPPYPFPHCGEDLTEDSWGCQQSQFCTPIVSFAGHPVTADGIYFVVDRSGSMQDSGELARAKSAIAAALSEIPDGTEFGIVFSDRAILRFPAGGGPALADAETRAAALDWLSSVFGGSGSCPEVAFSAALDWADRASGQRQAIYYVGDGGGTCAGQNEAIYLRNLIENVTARNRDRVQIHTFGVLMTGRSFQRSILTELAVRNGGAYFEIN